jgi:hypothetical protein
MKGRAGLRFRDLVPGTQEQLEKWLDERLEEEIPAARERGATDSRPQ